MDPLTAVSLAGTVVGLVDFLVKLTSAGYKLYKENDKGRGGENDKYLRFYDKARTAADDLTAYTKRLKAEISDGGFADEECEVIRRVCNESDAVAAQLIKKLSALRTRGMSEIVEIARLGIMAMWTKEEIKELGMRLEELRQSVDSTILRAMSRRLLSMELDTSSIFKEMDKQTRQITDALLHSQRHIVADAQSSTLALTQLLNRLEGYVPVSRFSVEGKIDPLKSNEEGVRKEATEEVLRSLWFPSVTERHQQVSEAHKRTFHWILKRPGPNETVQHSDGCRWSNFVTWLEEGNGLYWVTGKAGSGKSTLMKFIVDHNLTRYHLSRWAGPGKHRLLKAAFFFWNSGTKEQKSQEGFLKSLLLEILTNVPELVPIVFPHEWSKRYTSKLQSSWRFPSMHIWKLSSLELAFQILLEQKFEPLKICLFIDGLDEYEGDDGRIADVVMKAAQLQNVKICASSRPHIIFADTFAKLPSLRLQDLTHQDIMAYVSAVLLKDNRIQRLTHEKPDEVQDLSDTIVAHASGVFLWVTLVVASLLRGLGNRDDVAILRQRLDELPKDLEHLFDHMIRKIDNVYQAKASRLFQLVETASHHLDDKPFAISPLTLRMVLLAEADETHVFEAPGKFMMDKYELRDACQQMAITITSHSGGLLEVQSGDPNQIRPDARIGYLHRTVKDFMCGPDQSDIRSLLSDRTRGTESSVFRPSVALLRGHMLWLEDADTRSVVACAIQVDQDTAEAPRIDLIDRLFDLVSLATLEMMAKGNRDLRFREVFGVLHSSLALMARFGLENTLRAKLQSLGPGADDKVKAEISEALSIALAPDSVNTSIGHLLLEYRADVELASSRLSDRRSTRDDTEVAKDSRPSRLRFWCFS